MGEHEGKGAMAQSQAKTDETTYYVIQSPESQEVSALVADRGRGLYEWWTGEETGWVDTPYFVSYFAGGEPGARRVELEDVDDWKASVRVPDPMEVELLRAKGPGAAPPVKKSPAPADDGPPAAEDEPEEPAADEPEDATADAPADKNGAETASAQVTEGAAADKEPDTEEPAEDAEDAEEPAAAEEPEDEPEDDDDEKPGKPKKGVNPFPKKK